MKQIIATADAPPALGPYAQAVKVGDTIYVSGQLPLHPKTRQIVPGNIGAQTERVMLNIQAILEEGGATLEDVVKITIYLRDLEDFEAVNKVYSMFFPTADSVQDIEDEDEDTGEGISFYHYGDQKQSLPPARSTV
ncbi:MAG: Rid family detoxifying hydrolase, partial [Armatimonadota bacterium]|nr:Rid family detoxifying hydrolase [Armatimonadota bacterium]